MSWARVTIARLRVMIRPVRVTIARLKVTIRHPKVTNRSASESDDDFTTAAGTQKAGVLIYIRRPQP
ncbi:hypothetical protein [Bhargavaea massiliensis]|uniref:hypothetical protein n=1 Tax=Bhargavaea massiliensis TaxID=2697500 RepID=UPI001BCAEBA3|nr:hypothetical protein [Bhargavaea massiliensis]